MEPSLVADAYTPRSRRHRRRAQAVAFTLAMLTALGACANGSDESGPAASAVPPTSTRDTPAPSDTVPGEKPDVSAELTQLEERYDAVVGLYALDTSTGTTVAHRQDERFAYASTIKALAAAAVLERSGPADLEQVLTFTPEDLVPYSPVAEQHISTGLTLQQVIDAAIQESDNTAGNLLLERLGGPEGLESALREVGDETTVVARWEPDLNAYIPGDDRDTTTAAALATTLNRYALDGGLTDDDAEVLLDSMRGVVTGDGTIRAGAPDGWDVANKTGTGGHGTRNDVAILWADRDSDPVVLAVMTRTRAADGEPDDALLAEATEVALEALGHLPGH